VFFVKYFEYVFLKNLKDILMLFCTSILDSISGVDFIHWMIKKNISQKLQNDRRLFDSVFLLEIALYD